MTVNELKGILALYPDVVEVKIKVDGEWHNITDTEFDSGTAMLDHHRTLLLVGE